MSEEKQYYPENVTRDKPSALEAIRAYYNTRDSRHPVELTPKQEEIHERLLTAHALLLKKGTRAATITKMVKRFKISDRQAVRDLNDAIELFGDINKAKKEGLRFILWEKAMQAYQKAMQINDAKAMVSALKVASEVMGLNGDDADIPDFGRIQPSLNLLVLPPGMEYTIEQMLKQGVVKLNKPLKTIDITHEEMEDEADGE